MNCEEFASAGMDRELVIGGPESAAAREHLRSCPHCAALYESSLALGADLRELGQQTSDTTAPSRVEMRLRQEFRTLHTTEKNRGRMVVASWLLAAATLALVASSLVLWRKHGEVYSAKAHSSSATQVAAHAVATG